MYGNIVVILTPGLDIPEKIGLSLITFIYFGCSMLILLSDKLADEIDLDFFNVFTEYYISVILEALDLSSDIPFFYSLIMDLSFLLLDACGLSVLLTVSILFFAI